MRDTDGCPEDDDGDGIPDGRDRCPKQAEDKDGHKDYDGCPDPDNDGDGILDRRDKCPDVAEDKDGFEDSDGCPDDNDGDGVADSQDECPDAKEDGYGGGKQARDGCPTGRFGRMKFWPHDNVKYWNMASYNIGLNEEYVQIRGLLGWQSNNFEWGFSAPSTKCTNPAGQAWNLYGMYSESSAKASVAHL